VITRLPAVVAICLLTLAACTPAGPGPTTSPTPTPAAPAVYPGWPPETTDFAIIANPVSTEIAVGHDRLLVNIYNTQNQSLVSPDRPVELRFYDVASDPATPAFTADTAYLQILPPSIGLYRASVDFPHAGQWGLEAITTEADGSHLTGRMLFDVRESTTTPAIGAPAPSADTPTASTPDEVKAIATDPSPDPDFYRLSIADALAAGKPFLLIFATPAFCTSRTCGPALDIVKSVAADYKDKVNFINVEPYKLEQTDTGTLQLVTDPNTNYPIPVPAVEAYGLPTEPYIFVVDAAGKVTAKFEGVAGEDELRAALDAVTR
jgi:hypothetical protein